ncbi:MAG: DNA/RNA nuclease SfsA [Pseudobdellovibrionaceae bacterium]|jgi:sugar fermentation stimulation protein A
MQFETELLSGVFLKRYKRFFADVELSGQVEVAHVANTGSMKGVNNPGVRCLVSKSKNPERKLKFSLEALMDPQSGEWVGVNTSWPNQLAQEIFKQKYLSHWQNYDVMKPEHKINAETRLDLLLTNSTTQKQRFVEVKNVTLATGDLAAKAGVALFPDAVTERGQKHLRELTLLVKQGHEAEILFLIQRNDCISFKAAKDIDPDYAELLDQAKKSGVTITCVCAEISPQGIKINPRPIKFLQE